MDNTARIPLWKPDPSLRENANIKKYMDWLFIKKGLYFNTYEELWNWSVTDTESFWESLWIYFGIKKKDAYTQVLIRPKEGFIGAQWFDRTTLNYAEHVFRNKEKKRPAIWFRSERQKLTPISWDTLEAQVGAVAAWLRKIGIVPGDRVAGVLPNTPHAVAAFLAANAVGAVWSCCSPDFGNVAVIDRFQQIEPKVIFAVDGYVYNGREFHKQEDISLIRGAIPSVKHVVMIPYLDEQADFHDFVSWNDVLAVPASVLEFEAMPFSHPIWILYSSGTTGKPKAIVHSAGGCLLEHMKALIFHQDVRPGDNFMWYSTTGWMMWNYAVSALLTGASLTLYDGSPGFPDINVLWDIVSAAKVNQFGAGASFFSACVKAGDSLVKKDLRSVRCIGSTGSPLTPELFNWVYEHIKKDTWLVSLSGGTDVCTAFVGGCPLLPVYAGEIQCRMLGARVECFDDSGNAVIGKQGEMVITQPMPSMPVYFWKDTGNKKYYDSYFTRFENVWAHGDWIEITEDKTVIIYGRSDATLNRQGVRIGPSEIYGATESFGEVKDSLVVYLEDADRILLFLVLNDGASFTDELVNGIKTRLRSGYSPRHVPDQIIEVKEIPYTKSGKKMETPVKKVLMGANPGTAVSKEAMANPGSMTFFETLAQQMKQ
ncbi:acetoacetate--CoA ligase [Ravibacter arvi]|uniref:Acetoacetate--CoA ligase n=1 Tax=Ravibacter arvi TaxID=2051041 RepID=A0ABP8M414_9BACT